jgi:hypothetical protein
METCKDCDQVSNNKYHACPPLMHDGRLFTDYRPKCNSYDMSPQQGDTYAYRQYLISNAEKLMENNRKQARDAADCGACKQPYKDATMLPLKEMVSCTNVNCKVNQVNPNGIGRGVNYNAANLNDIDDVSDSYRSFLSVRTLDNQIAQSAASYDTKESCCTQGAFDALYHPLENLADLKQTRPAFPSGAVINQ